MYPPGHVAVAALASGPGRPFLAVVLGALLPDLIDKPLWLLGLVSGTRGVGHAVLTWVVVAAVAWGVQVLRPVAVGGVSHLLADLVDDLLGGVFHTGVVLTGWPLWPMHADQLRVGWTAAPVACSPLWHAAEAVVVAVALWAVARHRA